MGTRTGSWIDSAIVDYAAAHSTAPDPVRAWISAETAAKTGVQARMQIGADQSSVMTLITKLVGPTLAIEIGTFTGTSALAIARGLPDGGRLVCFDASEEWTSIAREAWTRAGVAERVELRIGNAIDELRTFLPGTTVDLAFIDADKTNYANYYEAILPGVRVGGLILVDNTIWYGRVLDDELVDADTVAVRSFNDARAVDDRVDVAMLTIGDGVTLLRKR